MNRAGLLGVWLSLTCGLVRAEVTLDGTLGPAAALAGPDYQIGAELGQQRGANLFHSFEQFNLADGERATFSGPATVANVIARVTGGVVSTIDGTLRSTIAGADLYLLNPAGLMFGAQAQLDIGGSFHVSSANYLRLGEQGRFDATLPANTVLASAPPSAFGFFGPDVAPVAMRDALLQVGAGRTLSVIGGAVDIDDAHLVAPAGRINLASVASAGEVLPMPDDLVAESPAALGEVSMRQTGARLQLADRATANLDTSGEGGGAVFIRAGRLQMVGAEVFADTFGAEPGRGVDVSVRQAVRLSDGAGLTADALPGASADGADVRVQAGGQITLEGESTRLATANRGGRGRGGTVTVTAPELRLQDRAAIVTQGTSGDSGAVRIAVDTLRITSAGRISSRTNGAGAGGDVVVDAAALIDISGRLTNALGGVDASGIDADTGGAGRGGSIVLRGPVVRIHDGAGVRAISEPLGGSGGSIVVEADRVEVRDAGMITVLTRSVRRDVAILPGDITVRAAESIEVAGQGAAISGSTRGDHRGGDIVLSAPRLAVRDGARVTVDSAQRRGDAGSITLAVDRLQLSGDAALAAQSERAGGGRIVVTASDAVVLSDSGITTTVQGGADNAGDIVMARPRAVALNGSLISANAVAGDGGNISIATGAFLASVDSTVEASSQLGIDGTIAVDAPDTDISGQLSVLPEAFLDVAALLSTSCAARRGIAASSLVRAGRGGLPRAPSHRLGGAAPSIVAQGGPERLVVVTHQDVPHRNRTCRPRSE